MRNTNWIEFSNEDKFDKAILDMKSISHFSKIRVFKEKKGKKGKTITVVNGINIANQSLNKKLLKKLKVFCSTGGKLIEEGMQLQGDMVDKVKELLRKEGYQI